LTCRICNWLHKRLGSRADISCDRLWAGIYDWEAAYSGDWDLWTGDENSQRLIDQAEAVSGTDPHTAFKMHLQAAEAGSSWAMQMVGWQYRWGTVEAADYELAQEYYRRAICAGSWSATLPYADLLAEQGHFEASEQVLQDGVDCGFVPAYYWLARLGLDRSRDRKTCREVRPLLEYAKDRGHPGAKYLLATMMLLGKFGLREIPAGFRRMLEYSAQEAEEQAEAGAAPTPAPA
jgi:TPR repeat protein